MASLSSHACLRNPAASILPASILLLLGGAAFWACSASGGALNGQAGPGSPPGTGGSGSALDLDGSSGVISVDDIVTPSCTQSCTDFPAAPILDSNVPANAASLFGDPSNMTAGALCIYEPEAGSLFPANWARPRFRFTPPSGANLFEIRLTTPKEVNPLVMYTAQTTFTMPKDVWQAVAQNVHDPDEITVTIRAVASTGGTPGGARSSFKIAPVTARGSMVYWATIGGQPADKNVDGDKYAWLEGFGVGEEGAVVALRQPQVNMSPLRDMGGNIKPAEYGSPAGRASCIGCHTSTPGGDAVLFNDHWPWGIAVASVEKDSVGQTPGYVTPGGIAAMSQAWLGVMATSSTVWQQGRHLLVTSFGSTGTTGFGTPPSSVGQSFTEQPNARLAWIDMGAGGTPPTSTNPSEFITWLAQQQGTSYGFIERQGDARGAETPDWTEDGSTVVYVSTAAGKDGRLAMGEADLYRVPFNDGKGGEAQPIQGAAETGVSEFYPAISSDGKLVAFNRVGNITTDMYYNKDSEVYVVPLTGGTAIPLAANQPVSCLNKSSPGVINSWPKWSPAAIPYQGRTYYWLIFSSAREPSITLTGPYVKDSRGSQLYIAGIVVEGDKITTYPAVYLWNQNKVTSNHTPAWDVFKIPPVTVY